MPLCGYLYWTEQMLNIGVIRGSTFSSSVSRTPKILHQEAIEAVLLPGSFFGNQLGHLAGLSDLSELRGEP